MITKQKLRQMSRNKYNHNNSNVNTINTPVNSNNESFVEYSNIKQTNTGEKVIDVSNISVVNFNEISLDYINKININPSNDGSVVYDDIMNPSSDYKNMLIKNMIKDVSNRTECLYDGTESMNNEYEKQLNSEYDIGNRHKMYMNDANKILYDNRNMLNDKL